MSAHRDRFVSKQDVPQVGIGRTEGRLVPCEGGPCDGQRMHIGEGRVLIVIDAKVAGEPLRAVCLPASTITLAVEMGTYVGHYELDGIEEYGDVARWTTEPPKQMRTVCVCGETENLVHGTCFACLSKIARGLA